MGFWLGLENILLLRGTCKIWLNELNTFPYLPNLRWELRCAITIQKKRTPRIPAILIDDLKRLHNNIKIYFSVYTVESQLSLLLFYSCWCTLLLPVGCVRNSVVCFYNFDSRKFQREHIAARTKWKLVKSQWWAFFCYFLLFTIFFYITIASHAPNNKFTILIY